MPHPGQQQNCIFPEISCKYNIYGNSLVSDQNSWSAQRKSLPVYGSSKQVIRFSDSKMHFRWLALKRLPPWRISWWRERLRQKQATTPEFEKQIYLMCLCEIVRNGIWQRQLLILKFEKGFFFKLDVSVQVLTKWFCNRGLLAVKRVNTRNASSSHIINFSLNRVSFFGFGP